MSGRPQRGELWSADLDSADPAHARGRLRTVLVLQANTLNNAVHPTTIVVPCSGAGQPLSAGDNYPLRVRLGQGGALASDVELLIDQVRAIDNGRLLQRLQIAPPPLVARVEQALRLITGP